MMPLKMKRNPVCLPESKMPRKRLLAVLFAIGLLVTFGSACGPRTRPASLAAVGLENAGAAEPPAPIPAPAPKRVSLIAVGDLMTDRNVGDAIARNGYRSILAEVRNLTSAADLSFANLECPLSTVGSHDPNNCCFRAQPSTVKVLVDGGFDIVSLANNHSLNAGREGIVQTYDVLDRQQISYCGAWRDKAHSGEPTVLQAGEGPLSFAFIGATDLSFDCGSYNKVAKDRGNLIAQVRAARKRADLVCVSLHWGDEYQTLPNKRQVGTAHAAIDAGADLILGHHPHVLEGIEVYRGKPILYSMGNFVFDQREGERMESAIFRLDYTQGSGWQICARPIWIPRPRLGPVFPSAARRGKILTRLEKISKPLGTTLQIKDGKAWLRIPEDAAAAAEVKGST